MELLWVRILGVLLILLGGALALSPRVTYTKHERIAHTQYTVKREKVILVPRSAAVLLAGSGVLVLLLGRGSRAV